MLKRQDLKSGWRGLRVRRLLFVAPVLALIAPAGLWMFKAQFQKQEQAALVEPQNAVSEAAGPDRPASHEQAQLEGPKERSLIFSSPEHALASPAPAKPESQTAAVFEPRSEMRSNASAAAVCGLEGRASEVQSTVADVHRMLKSADQALQRLLAEGYLRQSCPDGDLRQEAEHLEKRVKEAEEKRDTARERAEARVETPLPRIAGEKQGKEAKLETKSDSQRERLEATAQKQQRLVVKDCETCPELTIVPAGSFMMGSPRNEEGRSDSEGSQRRVTIGHSFAVGRFAITVDEFKEFVNDTGFRTGDFCAAGDEYKARSVGSFASPPGFATVFVQDGRHPVVCVNWLDAKAFLAWLSSKTKRNYRLLTEAEREYVTRAGASTAYWWGDGITPSQALYDVTSNSTRRSETGGAVNIASAGGTAPVERYQPNKWGLYQVHGNVAEWVEDCWTTAGAEASASPAAVVLPNCKDHVLRGGAWSYPKTALRAAFREHAPTDGRYNHIGFRVARDLDEQEPHP